MSVVARSFVSTRSAPEWDAQMNKRTDAQSIAWLDQENSLTAQMIREHGVFIQHVIGEPRLEYTSFSYTVGLFGIGEPELLVLGAGPNLAGHLLNEVASRVRAGHSLVAGELLTFENWPHRVVVEAVPNPGDIVFAANAFYRRPDEYSVSVVQLTYDDKHGHFPWEEGYSVPGWIQPRPGEFRA
jgi:hypothetical protein